MPPVAANGSATRGIGEKNELQIQMILSDSKRAGTAGCRHHKNAIHTANTPITLMTEILQNLSSCLQMKHYSITQTIQYPELVLLTVRVALLKPSKSKPAKFVTLHTWGKGHICQSYLVFEI